MLLMLQAFQTYQVEGEAARSLIPLATEVIHELRQLLIPPRTSPQSSPNTKKTTASAAGSVRVPAKRGQPSVSNRSVSGSGHPSVAAVKTLSASRNVAVPAKKRRSSVIPITEFDDIALLASMLCESLDFRIALC